MNTPSRSRHRFLKSLPVSALAFAGLLAGGVPSAEAAFATYQNFQDLSAGYDISGSDPNENFTVGDSNASLTPSGAFTVITDPTNAGNKVLQSGAVISRAFTGSLGALSVADNTTATIFYRVYRTGSGTTPDFNLGVADVATIPTGSVNAGTFYESQLNVSGAVGTGQHAEFSPRNGGTTINTDVVFATNSWFGIFQVINSTANTSQFYYQGQFDLTPSLLKSTGGTGIANFRNGLTNTNTLSNFLVLSGLPPSGTQDTFYLDDIYVDIAGSNLVAPVSIASVPEPTTAGVAVAVLCGIGILIRSRRRALS